MTESTVPPSRDSERGRRAAGQRQRHALTGLQQERDARREVLEVLRSRRGAREGFRQFEIDMLEHGEVLRLSDELLAREGAVDDPTAIALIAAAGFTAQPVECLRGRVVQVLKAGADRGEVDALRVALDAAGVRTSVAYMTPTRVVMKSTASPEHALEPPPALAAAPEAAAEAVAPKVVIVDTGVASRERDDGWLGGLQTDANKDLLDVFPRPNGYLDLSAGHGTFVAGLFQQADPGLDLQVIKALDTDGFAHEVDVACAIVRSVEEHLRPGGKLVLNLSLGADTVDDLPPLALEAALQIVRELESARGGEVLLVAAAGNDGGSTRCWPAAFAQDDDRVVAVAGLTAAGEPAPWSTRAEWVTCSAVGEAVMSTYVTGREDPDLDADPEVFGKNAWAYWTGTSFAAPQVGAAVASLARRTGTSLPDALRQVLASGSGRDPLYGSLLPDLPH